MRIHHVGIVVRDIDKSIQIYTKIGYSVQCDVIDDHQKCRIVFMDCRAAPKIELIKPLNTEAAVYNYGAGYHHICYEAEQGEDMLKVFRQMKIGKIFTKPVSAVAIDDREIIFACLTNGTLVELIL